jgi:peroxiredoxin
MKVVTIKIAALALAGAIGSIGLLLGYLSTKPVVINEPILEAAPRHEVTDDMIRFSNERKLKTAPAFSIDDAFGQRVKIADPQNPKPQFVYFIKDGCPCSIEVEPLFHDLFKIYGDRVDFIGVHNKDAKTARQWHTDMLMPYTVVPDPKLNIINAYEIESSAFSVLVSQDGKMVKMWPGYSRDILLEMNELLAKEVGLRAMKFDTKYAPKRATTGCRFDSPSNA